jgi:hypothetical protein
MDGIRRNRLEIDGFPIGQRRRAGGTSSIGGGGDRRGTAASGGAYSRERTHGYLKRAVGSGELGETLGE